MSKDDIKVKLADIQWLDNGTPKSEIFDDIYFSPEDGLSESHYVFIQHNRLEERWHSLPQTDNRSERTQFVIAEAGFGTGLNFLISWQLWQRTAPASANLHYIGIEKYPLSRSELKRALMAWEELAPLSEELVDKYPSPLPGLHAIDLGGTTTGQDRASVRLTIIVGDINDGLEQLKETNFPFHAVAPALLVDAWFLDGFAPSKNPQMWSAQLFRQMAQLSKSGTSFATFTAAGDVRRGMEAAGFDVKKAHGFGRKREMLFGEFGGQATDVDEKSRMQQKKINSSIYGPLWYIQPPPMQSAKTAIVIGGGIAGCTSARSLARRGWQVTLIERHNSLASEGSGNPAGIIYSKLAATLHTPHNRFALMSFLFALRFYKHLLRNCRQHANTIDASLCGVLQLAHNDKELASWRQLGNSYRQYSELVQFLDAAQASRVSGIEVSQPALFFPDAGWLCFPELCQYLAHHSQINILLERQVKQLLYADEQWQLLDDKGSLIAQAPVVILANAADARELVPDVNLPVKSIRGQITSVPATNESAALKTVICHSGYVTPATTKGIHCLGATYTLHDNDERVRNTDHQENWQQLRRHLPSLSQLIEPPDINDNTGRVAFRCVSPDYLPLLGPMPDSQQFLSDYSALRKNARADIPIPGHYQRGLYTNIGHGSRGLANAPVCAELLASLICGEIRPLEQPLVQALNPGRFIIRNLRRNKI